ncbi:bifunctional UDP-N-acetylglucosamine diphosphorylase/glucosamine-1-phosphate N-acetyltransferase GlmU [Selenomonas sp. TAMA-11512]|uniref:bifunctional UDP-N-acetylglucosamine diphosphorylase/glucosamine-1-phosphate N-acetyltransferase GlmU n=1 Tax=Selenomonas sp. TAMA-11512 TaxID=3095337 RepID=UPI00308AACC1|nr:bifunctional UDP-N-acetylglucosamine diphosphorylase/glucosamine-1-phosphate N-acetyltransferase GlmU [Selenomonas sp. TAMA-11512]
MQNLTAVILAAGKGTRMKSSLPKVLHKVGGKSMLEHVLDAAEGAGAKRKVVVVGFGGDVVKEALGERAEFVTQAEQLGTGHAVRQTESLLKNEKGSIMVLCGDTPLLTTKLLENLAVAHEESGAAATVLTAIMPDAAGYGRVIRASDGTVEKIVEHKDATEAERKVREVNSGIYCFDAEALFSALSEVTADNAQGEYYLPDVLWILKDRGEKVRAVEADDYEETLGINSRVQLAGAEKILRQRKNIELMNAGVTIMDPGTTYVDAGVTVGRDTILYPGTWLEGNTTIGERSEIGPHTRFTNAKIGDDVIAVFSYGHDCEIDSGVTMGPYVHIRPNTHLKRDVHVGNFVEVKNSVIGAGSKLPHLSYIGDTDMGCGVNMGCGTITVNYDGREKHRTTVGDHAFVGCNTNLVAPVTVGEGAYIGAGSTITKDVEPESLAIARARQSAIPGWAKGKTKK